MAFLLGLVAPHALLMPSPARHAGPALKGRASAAPTMTAYGQQSCQQPDIGGIRSGEIGTPYPGPIESPACTRDAWRDLLIRKEGGPCLRRDASRVTVAPGFREHAGT